MMLRTSTRTVTFQRPFIIVGVDRPLPAGEYDVETDEELIEGISFHAYRRIRTYIQLPPRPGHPGIVETLTVDPDELDAALKRDQGRSVELAGGPSAGA